MIIHTGTNDAPSSTSREIQQNLLNLKALVNEKLPQCKVWLSTPILRTDNGKATLTVSQLVNHLLNLNIDVNYNRNIKSRHLSRKGLDLNDSGSKLLVRNVLEKIKLFRVDERCSSIIKDNELGYLSKNDCYDNPSGKTSHKEKHTEKDQSFGEVLNDVREKNINRTIIGQLNINSIRNKFHFLESEASKHLGILLISETKIDVSFPSAQFLLDGFSRPYRLDRFANGGGILLYVRDGISSCLLTEYKLEDNTECLFIEINIRKKKWLFCCPCNLSKNISKHLHCLSKGLDTYISQYDNIVLLGDLNVESWDPLLNDFCNVYY